MKLAGRAIDANSSVAANAVELLSSYGIRHDYILTALGPRPEVLAALQGPYLSADDAEGYMRTVEISVPRATKDVLQAYRDVCSRQGAWPRLRQHLESAGPFVSAVDEAKRLELIGTSLFVGGDFDGAASLARRALSFRADDSILLEFLGDCLGALGRNE